MTPSTHCGLAAALVLRKNGIPARLIEKALDYQIGVRGNGIQPRIPKLFKILGLVPDTFDNSIEPLQMRAYDGKTVIRKNSHVLTFVTSELLKHDKRGFSENEALEVDWMMDADGAQGITPKHGINFWGEMLERQACLVADIDMEGSGREYWVAYGSATTRFIASHRIVQSAGLAHASGSSSLLLSSQFSVESSLVMKNLSPHSLLSNAPVKEMLKLITNLHTQSMSDRDMASKDTSQSVNPGFVHEHIFKQLGVNYQRSEIVLDRGLDRGKKVDVRTKV
ncbi:hypothetical protein BS47DRAFT_1382358 [Hydnum rufescens UP504]|uniref:Uncharacterized protein n=1 Tax=Hydnum rufescens UP504 TaxID=1448309 RepID=A0A9P6DXB9_9AGAM|nr:hypothetical protein BS47DRAFT_1382358 [Hydnum rufescens UP504]